MWTKILLILLILFGPIQSARADTIDFWHVYYNNIKIKEFNQYGQNTVILRLGKIKDGDSIVVKYFRDTPCSECLTNLIVQDNQHNIIATGKGTGTFNPIAFPLINLVKINKVTDKNSFTVFYYEVGIGGTQDQIMIFKIKLE